jgi:Wiskott-Aldrich syndrome protein
MVGINFANDGEAEKFSSAVESKIQFARRATLKRKPPEAENTPPTVSVSRPPTSSSVPPPSNDPYSLGAGKKAPVNKAKRKITKADIGLPTDFRHLAHVGWDPNTGAFNVSVNTYW